MIYPNANIVEYRHWDNKLKTLRGTVKMLNIKQKELSEKLFLTLKEHYPEIALVEIVENPFGGDVWMRINPPINNIQKNQFVEMAAELSTDVLLEYGYDITITYVTQSSAIH